LVVLIDSRLARPRAGLLERQSGRKRVRNPLLLLFSLLTLSPLVDRDARRLMRPFRLGSTFFEVGFERRRCCHSGARRRAARVPFGRSDRLRPQTGEKSASPPLFSADSVSSRRQRHAPPDVPTRARSVQRFSKLASTRRFVAVRQLRPQYHLSLHHSNAARGLLRSCCHKFGVAGRQQEHGHICCVDRNGAGMLCSATNLGFFIRVLVIAVSAVDPIYWGWLFLTVALPLSCHRGDRFCGLSSAQAEQCHVLLRFPCQGLAFSGAVA
jgi:hypothetical protein